MASLAEANAAAFTNHITGIFSSLESQQDVALIPNIVIQVCDDIANANDALRRETHLVAMKAIEKGLRSPLGYRTSPFIPVMVHTCMARLGKAPPVREAYLPDFEDVDDTVAEIASLFHTSAVASTDRIDKVVRGLRSKSAASVFTTYLCDVLLTRFHILGSVTQQEVNGDFVKNTLTLLEKCNEGNDRVKAMERLRAGHLDGLASLLMESVVSMGRNGENEDPSALLRAFLAVLNYCGPSVCEAVVLHPRFVPASSEVTLLCLRAIKARRHWVVFHLASRFGADPFKTFTVSRVDLDDENRGFIARAAVNAAKAVISVFSGSAAREADEQKREAQVFTSLFIEAIRLNAALELFTLLLVSFARRPKAFYDQGMDAAFLLDRGGEVRRVDQSSLSFRLATRWVSSLMAFEGETSFGLLSSFVDLFSVGGTLSHIRMLPLAVSEARSALLNPLHTKFLLPRADWRPAVTQLNAMILDPEADEQDIVDYLLRHDEAVEQFRFLPGGFEEHPDSRVGYLYLLTELAFGDNNKITYKASSSAPLNGCTLYPLMVLNALYKATGTSAGVGLSKSRIEERLAYIVANTDSPPLVLANGDASLAALNIGNAHTEARDHLRNVSLNMHEVLSFIIAQADCHSREEVLERLATYRKHNPYYRT